MVCVILVLWTSASLPDLAALALGAKRTAGDHGDGVGGEECASDADCARNRAAVCPSGGCRCRPWGRCEPAPAPAPAPAAAGQPCHRAARCAAGLVCGGGSRCVPDARLEDLPRFADLPESDLGSHADIPATYGGPLLVAAISLALVVLCLALAAWCRLTAPSSGRLQAAASSSVLISMNHLPQAALPLPLPLPAPCYSSTDRCCGVPPPPCHRQHRYHHRHYSDDGERYQFR